MFREWNDFSILVNILIVEYTSSAAMFVAFGREAVGQCGDVQALQTGNVLEVGWLEAR